MPGTMRFPLRLLSALALVAALSAQAEVRAEGSAVLHEPRQGAVLRGGSTATISWSATGTLEGFVEEWEAFLSVDGGRYYAYRITPHLDLDRRSFTFEVPNVETTQARILIRAGNERREIELASPQTFAIARDQAQALTEAPREIDEDERGEAARPGDRGVISWTDGDRDGTHLTPRSALAHHGTLTHSQTPEPASEAGVVSGASPERRPTAATSTFALRLTSLAPRDVSGQRNGRDRLLAYRRLNI
jgi:hypothetical protein